MARPSEALADYLAHTTDGFYNTNAPWLPDVTGIYNDFSDRSLAPAQVYHWLHALDSLGVVDTTSADYPAAMVFQKNGVKNYVVDNSTTTNLLVNFSDGEQVLVPANSIETKAIPISACLAATTNLIIDNENVIGNYVANSITTSNIVTTTTQARFRAKNSITLSNGFHAQAGSNFLATIEDCSANFQNETGISAKQIIDNPTNLTPQEITKSLSVKVYPNPFANQFTIDYHLPESGNTLIYLTNVLGQNLLVLKRNDFQEKGHYQLVSTTTDLEAGVYFVVVKSGSSTIVRQLIRL